MRLAFKKLSVTGPYGAMLDIESGVHVRVQALRAFGVLAAGGRWDSFMRALKAVLQ